MGTVEGISWALLTARTLALPTVLSMTGKQPGSLKPVCLKRLVINARKPRVTFNKEKENGNNNIGSTIWHVCISSRLRDLAMKHGARTALSRRRGSDPGPEREDESKREYERLVNALDDERRAQQEALTEAFDYLNDNQPFGSHNEGLMQVRNMLMRTIQLSTYGRG